MKTQLQKELAQIAPSISIETIWEIDEHAACDWKFLSQPGNCFHGEDSDDWQCWQSKVKATAIQAGEEVSGSAYMGGTWEKYGDNPAVTNPDISGYEPQMAVEALEELLPKCDESTAAQIQEAITHVQRMMQFEWTAQQQLATA